ncbi:TPA: hypothetical protein HA251_07125 [Candidatus Woesearchaeota archaeon]|nr:hypothetical protein [Candidatus Woesearchaeota archaeon]
MLRAKERKHLDSALTFSPKEQAILRSAMARAKTIRGCAVGGIGCVPRYIQQTAPDPHSPTRKVMVLAELTLANELFNPQMRELASEFREEDIYDILHGYDKWHILQMHSAIMDVHRRPRWYNRLLGRHDHSARETIDIVAQQTLLDGVYLSRTEANTVLGGIKLLGKGTRDAVAVYNGLDAIAYAAIMHSTCSRPRPSEADQHD